MIFAMERAERFGAAAGFAAGLRLAAVFLACFFAAIAHSP
jgi:hypothetical protein